jgi:conjugative relaxase-like TrwC/TraI family protein
MITYHAIGSGANAAAYHDKAFSAEGNVRDADNYYMDESAGAKWQGKGARVLGIEGTQVDREDFINFLDGKLLNPETGKTQNLASRGNADRRAGFDLSVAPPKSVSVMALVAGDDRLIKAHENANNKAMSWLEEHASLIRVKDNQGENVKEQTGNLLWATIRHETNRENEPQLHNHNVVPAVTYDLDRKTWRSLTNDEILVLRNGADDIYKATLLQETRLAGYQVEHSKNGRDFEIAGMSAQQIAAFSGRSQQIDDAIRARGFDPEDASWAMRQAAALDTRAKKHDLPSDVLNSAWNERAQELGLNLAGMVDAAKERAATLDPEALKAEDKRLASLAVSEAIEHLAEREQAFTVANLEKTAALMGKSVIEDVKAAIEDHREGHMILGRDGMPSGAAWLTTQKALNAEKELVSTIVEGFGKGQAVLSSSSEFDQMLSEFEAKKSQALGIDFKLSGEQVNAAKNTLMHHDKFQAIQGDAGTGKTAALEFVREVAESKGWNIQGVATTSSAAEELQASSGIKSNTIAGFFADRKNAAKDLSMEIEALKYKLQTAGQDRGPAAPRIEVKHLEVRSFDLNFGTNRYTFDHKTESVYKSDGGLMSRVAGLLLDAAEKHRGGAEKLTGEASTLGERLKVFASEKVVGLAESLGEKMISYEKVGVVEAHAARNALYTANREERMSKVIEQLNTKEAQFRNLSAHGDLAGRPTLYVMDEASMTGANDWLRFVKFVAKNGARGVFQGDIQQHGSVASGRAFEQAQAAGMNVSVLEETKRFERATRQTKEAVKAIKGRGYAEAIGMLDRTEVESKDLASVVASRYLANLTELKSQGVESPVVAVIAVTNKDRKDTNSQIQGLLQVNGLLGADNFGKEHFDDPQLTSAEKRNAGILSGANVNRLVLNQNYKEVGLSRGDVIVVKAYDVERNRIIGTVEGRGVPVSINPDKQRNFSPYVLDKREFAVGDKIETRAIIRQGKGEDAVLIKNGKRGVVTGLTDQGASVKWSDGRETQLSNASLRSTDLGYAHTTVKDQGATYHRMIIAASDKGAAVFNRHSVYVASTRAKFNTEIVTSNFEGMLKSAGKDSAKTTAHDLTSSVNHSDALIKQLELSKANERGGEDRGVQTIKTETKVRRGQEKSSGLDRM